MKTHCHIFIFFVSLIFLSCTGTSVIFGAKGSESFADSSPTGETKAEYRILFSKLQRAIYHKNLQVVTKIITQHKNHLINSSESNGVTPLHSAIRHYDRDVLLYILKQASDINLKDFHGNTPLHRAVCKRNAEAVKLIFEHTQPDLSLKNKKGYTAFRLARKLGNNEVIKLFVEALYGDKIRKVLKSDGTDLKQFLAKQKPKRRQETIHFLKAYYPILMQKL